MKCQSSCTVLGCQHRSVHPVLSETCTPVACWRDLVGLQQCSSYSSLDKGAVTGPAAGLMPFYGCVQLSLCNSRSALFSPPCSWDNEGDKSNLLATAWMDVPSWSWTTCETWLGCRYHLMLSMVTRTQAENKTREQSVGKNKKREFVCGHHMQNHSPFWGCLVFAPPLQLVSLSTAPKQGKLIHIHLCKTMQIHFKLF